VEEEGAWGGGAQEQGRLGSLTGGAPATVTGGRVKPRLNQFKFKWFNSIQIFSNFDRSEQHIPILEKIEVKYGFEGLEEMNNFLHKNFFTFKIYFELKI
jgi:hypothetical protein